MAEAVKEAPVAAAAAAEPEISPFEGLTVPRAEPPAPPCRIDAVHLASSPNFDIYAASLTELQDVSRKLQEVTSSGRQLSYLALARLQRSDSEGSAAAFASIQALPSLEAVMGPTYWESPELRLQLCQTSGVGYFMETHVASLGLMSFLERGVLTPEVPISWLVGVKDYDDELYLLGVIGALREVERYAVNRGQELDLPSVRLCLGAAQSLEEALMQFSFRNSDLRQRFDGVKYCVRRLESLAYEIDLALQRAAATSAASGVGPRGGGGAGAGEAAAVEDAAVAAEAAARAAVGTAPAAAGGVEATVISLQLIGDIKVRYDAYDEQREVVMKRSRDVIKAAKNAVYALHREDYRKADTFLKQCTKDAQEIYRDVIVLYPRLRDGFFSSCLEEFAEACVYRAFRQDRQLMSFEDLQTKSGLSFTLSISEYLGGIMDLTGEVGRWAVRSASGGRKAKPTIELCLACVDAVYNGVQQLPSMPSNLNKKIRPLKTTLTKIEGTLYELALLSQGISVRIDDVAAEPQEPE